MSLAPDHNEGVERRGIGPPNAEILEEDLTGYADSLDDIGYAPQPDRWFPTPGDVLDRLNIMPEGWSNSSELADLGFSLQFHPSLRDYDTTSTDFHDVYLVTVPRTALLISMHHWSFYSQGQFFHLVNKKTPQLNQDIGPWSSEDVEKDLAAIRREVDSNTFHHTTKDGKRLPLIAYNVGQTQFNLQQITKLARHVIKYFDTYTFTGRNCQLFALSLMYRAVMTKRDGSAFVGTKAQIINFDLNLKNSGSALPFNQYVGYFIAKKELDVSGGSRKYFKNFLGAMARSDLIDTSLAVATLYRSGPAAIGSFDPTGSQSRLAYAAAESRQTLSSASQEVMTSVKECVQDLAKGRFRSALRGRDESRLKSFKEVLIRAKRGDKLTQNAISYHRFCLSITDEEERQIRAEVDKLEP